jgi:sulfite exporter TauE/SafE
MSTIVLNLFLAGLCFGAGPCMASCGPLLICYLAGTQKNIAQGLFNYSIFSLSRICAYFSLALLIFFLGRFTFERLSAEYSRYIFIFGGIFIIFVGVVMALGKHLESRFFSRLQRFILKRDFKNVILFGLIIGFLPCPPLIVILSSIGLISKSWPSTLLYSFAFGLGTFLSPLILLVIITGVIPKLIVENLKTYYRFFNLVCGLVIIVLGIQLLKRAF